LLLCNAKPSPRPSVSGNRRPSSDQQEPMDEIAVVDELDVERLVNDARCPTRVERCSAARSGPGLRVGYKWLVRSVIANMVDLGPRVEADVALEARLEEKRRAELRKRLEEERKQREFEGEDVADGGEEGGGEGFIPLSEMRAKWREEQEEVKRGEEVVKENEENEASLHEEKAKVVNGGVVVVHEGQDTLLEEDEDDGASGDTGHLATGLPSPSNNSFMLIETNGGASLAGLPPIKTG